MISFLLPREEASILQQARESGPRNFFIIYLALNTGIRNTELISLDCKDVFFYGTILKLMELSKASTKNHKPRIIPIHQNLQNEIQIFLDWKKSHSEDLSSDAPLFVSLKTRNRLSSRDFQHIVRAISIKAIQRPIHPHTLRHTFATKILRKTNIRVVQELLGHSSVVSTQIYTHVTSEDLIDAINLLD